METFFIYYFFRFFQFQFSSIGWISSSPATNSWKTSFFLRYRYVTLKAHSVYICWLVMCCVYGKRTSQLQVYLKLTFCEVFWLLREYEFLSFSLTLIASLLPLFINRITGLLGMRWFCDKIHLESTKIGCHPHRGVH